MRRVRARWGDGADTYVHMTAKGDLTPHLPVFFFTLQTLAELVSVDTLFLSLTRCFSFLSTSKNLKNWCVISSFRICLHLFNYFKIIYRSLTRLNCLNGRFRGKRMSFILSEHYRRSKFVDTNIQFWTITRWNYFYIKKK